MILITTPMGDIGARVLRRVIEAGADVRALLRDPTKLPAGMADRIDVVKGSHGDPAAIGPALEGVEAVFWLPPSPPTATGPTADHRCSAARHNGHSLLVQNIDAS